MKVLTFSHPQNPSNLKLGLLIDNVVVDLSVARTWAQGARNLPSEELPETMYELMFRGADFTDYINRLIEVLQGEDLLHLKGAYHLAVGYPQDQIRLFPPLPRLTTFRDFYAFEDHVRQTFSNRGEEIPSEWYQFPAFYFSNPNAIYGHQAVIPYPPNSQALDFELQVCCVIGKAGKDIPPARAMDFVLGFSILNDWSARDLQMKEMRIGLGPSKSKDFATSMGPWIITPDEIANQSTDRPGVYNLQMKARINGETVSQGNWKDIYYSFGEMIASASAGVFLYPGDVLGSGTVGTGCLLETTKGHGPWLRPGDVVELEIDQIGVLSNQVAKTLSQ